MIDFLTFLERKERNPLRKRELEKSNRVDNKKWVDDKSKDMSEVDSNQLKADYLSPKIGENHKILLQREGIRVYTDEYVTIDHDKNSEMYYLMLEHVNILLGRQNKSSAKNSLKPSHKKSNLPDQAYNFRDILPNKKPKVVITDFETNPVANNMGSSAGFYFKKTIFLDQNSLNHEHLLIHEYAHYLADSIPIRTRKILEDAYKNLLTDYFKMRGQKGTSRNSLEGDVNEKHRIAMAKHLGLPSDYASTNFGEWFAEFISHWRTFKQKPQTKEWYKMKQMVKKALFSL
jgi:hypothetical protein